MDSELRMQASYELQVIKDDEYTIVSSEMSWLDKCMLYVIGVTKTPSGKHRSKCLRIAFITIQILAFFSVSSYIGYWSYRTVTEKNDIYNTTVALLSNISTITLRILSLYYFNFKFEYFWYSQLGRFQVVKWYKYMIIVYIVFVIMVIISFSVSAMSIMIKDEDKWYNIIGQFLENVFGFWLYSMPNLFINVMVCVIALKYKYYLLRIIDGINDKSTELADLMDRYKLIAKEFKHDMAPILTCGVYFNFIPLLLIIWRTIFLLTAGTMKDKEGRLTLFVTSYVELGPLLIMYVIAGCYLNETYESMHAALRITRRSTFFFVVGFAVSRIVSLYFAQLN